MCQRCLADRLVGVAVPRDLAVPPLIGTAVHALIEEVMADEPGVLRETRVTVGDIRGYGPITGTMDYFDTTNHHALDYKVIGKKKIAEFNRAMSVTRDGEVIFDSSSMYASTLKQYWIQLSLYSKGMEDLGHTVENMSLLLIPRDETTTPLKDAVREIIFPYNRHVAELALERASDIYEWATSHSDALSELESDKNCYYCKFERWKETLE